MPSSASKGAPPLTRKGIGDYLVVAQGPSGSTTGTVKSRTSVWMAVCCHSVDFEGPAIVGHSGYRPPAYCNPTNLVIVTDGNAEFSARDRLMMTMVLRYKSVCLGQRHRDYP